MQQKKTRQPKNQGKTIAVPDKDDRDTSRRHGRGVRWIETGKDI